MAQTYEFSRIRAKLLLCPSFTNFQTVEIGPRGSHEVKSLLQMMEDHLHLDHKKVVLLDYKISWCKYISPMLSCIRYQLRFVIVQDYSCKTM